MQNRKLITLAVALFYFTFSTSAQEAKPTDYGDYSDKEFFYEQGLNATQFAKQYLSFNSLNANSLPYLFTGNLVYKHVGFRYGFNVVNATTNSSADPTGANAIFNSANTDKSKSSTYNTRGGFFYYKRLSKRFVTQMGVDFLYVLDKFERNLHNSGSSGSNTTFVSDVNTKRSTNIMGFGPFFSVQYFVAPRISLGTESSIYYTMSNQKQSGTNTTTQTFNNGGFSQSTATTTTTKSSDEFTNTDILIPLSLFIYFRF